MGQSSQSPTAAQCGSRRTQRSTTTSPSTVTRRYASAAFPGATVCRPVLRSRSVQTGKVSKRAEAVADRRPLERRLPGAELDVDNARDVSAPRPDLERVERRVRTADHPDAVRSGPARFRPTPAVRERVEVVALAHVVDERGQGGDLIGPHHVEAERIGARKGQCSGSPTRADEWDRGRRAPPTSHPS